MGTPYKYTFEFLEPIVAEATSVADVLRILGLRANGGTHSHISRAIKRYELDTSHFRRKPIGGLRPKLDATAILTRRDPGSRREKPHLLRRAMSESGVAYQCARCGIDGTWLGEPITLDVDHIDGDLHNNTLENLRFLCPNCHRLTPNFAGRSKGKFSSRTALSIGREADA